MINVLLIEDDRDMADTVIDYLAFKDITCHHASNGFAGEQIMSGNSYSVLLLDINMPKVDGLTLCRRLRLKGDNTPILMLTAMGALEDKIVGFNAGADDYLVKPFALEELEARIKSLSSRKSGLVQKLSCGDLEMDLESKSVKREGKILKLSPTLWILLETLLRASPGVMSRNGLEDKVWGDEVPSSNSLRVYMCNLRKIIDNPFSTPLLHTISRHGFALFENADQ